MASVADLFQAAVEHQRRGEFANAAQLCAQVIAAEPLHGQALHLWGALALQTNQLPLAVDLLERAIAIDGSQARLHATLSEILRASGRLIEARAACLQAIALVPGAARQHCQLASILRELGEADAARDQLALAIRLQPDSARAYFLLGNLEAVESRWPQVIAAYEQALRCQPHFAAAEARLAVALDSSGSSNAAEHFRRATELEPQNAEYLFNWGVSLSRRGHTGDAAGAFDRTLQLNPAHLGAMLNRGAIHQDLGQDEQALVAYDRALAVDSTTAEAHYNRSLIFLARGQFVAGWAAYDWRRRLPGFPVRDFDQPVWDGRRLARGTLLIHAEQGLGDTLQFVRYLPLARQLVERAVLLAPVSLLPLLTDSGFADLIGTEAELSFDYHVPLMSLPGLLDPPPSSDAWPSAYLHSSPDLVTRWRQRLESLRGLKVGIAWQGSSTHRSDHRRSIPLAAFAPLSEVTGVQLISLQKAEGTEQIAAAPFSTHQLAGDWDQSAGAFMDTAAVMQSLDLVITADTAIAHLAGGLGIPLWIALAHRPDWRWLQTGDTTPWYPTARLFRQEIAGDWASVFEEMAKALRCYREN